jgi:CubicO group peptidase (beta-lactamase class C family)
VDQKMIDFFPEIADRITDPRKTDITIRHLLQMRAGYPWEETDPELWDGLLSGHYPPLIEAIPLLGDPGTQFNYSNLSSNWLGIILARATGTNLRSFAQKHLLSPIGAEAGEWGTDAEGHNQGCGVLHMTARDAAKFGLLYLNHGRWGGQQIVPADWVEQSLTSYSEDTWIAQARLDHQGAYFRDLGYGYQWWSAQVGAHDIDYAAGHGGQLIILLHDMDMVIVATSYPFFLQHDDEAWKHEKSTFNLVGKFIHLLPSASSGSETRRATPGNAGRGGGEKATSPGAR